jgi:hypothetical protein
LRTPPARRAEWRRGDDIARERRSGETLTRVAGRLLLLLTLLASMLLSAPLSGRAAPPVTDRELLFGVAGHAWWLDDHLDAFMAAYRDLGVTTVRLSVDWKYIEPSPGVYRWDRYDRVLRRLADDRVVVVGVFVTVPAWASADAAGCAVEEREPQACSLLPERRPDFERVTRAILTRYPFIRHWEYWNEPELWTYLGRDIGDYLPLLTRFYAIAKEVDPEIQVAAGSLAGWDYLGWLYAAAEDTLGPGVRPWDAVAFHPYNTHLQRDENGEEMAMRFGEIERVRTEMVARGDAHKPIWITEYGWHFEPEQQTRALRRAMRWMIARDYITMAHLHMLHDWEKERFGLLRTVPDVFGRGPIDQATRFEPKEPYYSAFRGYARPEPPLAPIDQAASATGQRIAPEFADAPVVKAGGLGWPLTRPFWERRPAGQYVLAQYFERGRLEWTRADGVQIALIGDEALQRRGWLDVAGQPTNAATLARAPVEGDGTRYFPETGHTLAGAFLEAWTAAGGVADLGFPRTAVLTADLPDGAQLLTQYTQRGRLEQVVTAGVGGPVLFGRLGAEAAQARGWLGPDGQPLPIYLNPARRSFQ